MAITNASAAITATGLPKSYGDSSQADAAPTRVACDRREGTGC
jgi:hypothetical protein